MKISRTTDLPKKISSPKGETIQEILGLVAGNVKSHSLAEVKIPPGNASSKHFHKFSEESYLILSGEAALDINGNEFTLFPGEAVLIEPQEIHQISNQTSEELAFIAVCVPAWSPDDSFDVEIGDK
jgi:mannose-6-phosphate isomerase-like protein (cupin superfamily)